ncbi:MAG: hypothetical protein ACRDWB_12690, partial [Acidimicrobiales bacterium]
MHRSTTTSTALQPPSKTRAVTPKPSLRLAVVVALAVVAASCGGNSAAPSAPGERVSGGPTGTYIVPAGIHKIKHVI